MPQNISDWILNNNFPHKIKLGDVVNEILLNIPDAYLVGEPYYGFYYFGNGYRFGFSENTIEEIGLEIDHSDTDVLISDQQQTLNLKTLKIHEVLDFFNNNFISWDPITEKDKSVLLIKLSINSIYIVFDIYKGTVLSIFQVK